MAQVLKFICISFALIFPLSVFAIEMSSSSGAAPHSYLPPKQDNSEQQSQLSSFVPNAREYDWQAASDVKTPAIVAVPKKRGVRLSWIAIGSVCLFGGLGSYWLGRRRKNTVVADERYSERQRVLDTNKFYVSVPGPVHAVTEKSGAPLVPVVSSGAFDLFLGRASLLTGKSSGPDMGRC